MDIAGQSKQLPSSVMGDGRAAPSLASVVANGLMFNISWLAIVLTHSSLLAPAVVLLHLLLHFRWFGHGAVEARLIVVVTGVGVVLDQILFMAGVLTSPGALPLAPLWLSCLWPVLATTLMHAFSGLRKRLVLASLFGAVGGAGSYVAGTRLSDVEFASMVWGPAVMAAAWALLFPALLVGASLATRGGDNDAT
jgi:hypothetical protein